jgi:hypothetical protein
MSMRVTLDMPVAIRVSTKPGGKSAALADE